MGQHKHNPTALAAREGKLPPKPKRPSKLEREAMAYMAVENAIRKHFGLNPFNLLDSYTDGKYY